MDKYILLEQIVKALELFEKSKILRRMYYAGIAIGLLYGVAAVLGAIAHFSK